MHTYTTTQIHTDIHAAYKELSVKANDWVRLARLLPLVRQRHGYSDQEIQAALTDFYLTEDANFVPDSNRKVLTQEDHDNAYRYNARSEAKELIGFWED